MATERRLTMHNGRSHKGGKTFSAKHNDHLQDNGNWDKDKRNECWFWKSKNCPGKTFDEGEKAFYEKFFRKALDAQNERHKKSRHLERIKTMDEYRACKNYCPEETLVYLGDKDHQADKEALKEVVQDFVNWHRKTYPRCVVLNIALHADEKGADHIHMRKVWMAKDKDGHWIVGQNRSLEQMGVKPPHPDEEVTADNNAKKTYTAMCRAKLFELAKEKGVELVEEPRSKEESGKSRSEFIAEKVFKPYIEAVERLIAQFETLKPKDREKERGTIENLLKQSNRVFGNTNGMRKATAALKRESERIEATYLSIDEPEGWER